MVMEYISPELYKAIDSERSYVKEKSSIGAETEYTGISWTHIQQAGTTYNSDLKGLYNSVGMTTKFFSSEEYRPVWEKFADLRAENVIIGSVAQSNFSGSMDAQSIKVIIPSGGTMGDQYTLYGATFDAEDAWTSPNNGQDETWIPTVGPVAWLFCDEVNKPYTGTVYGYETNPNSSTYSWSGHPVATPAWAGDSGHDVAQGFVVLDQGLVVLTDSTITTNFGWAGREEVSGGTRRIAVFTSDSSLTFKPKTITVSQVYYCHAEPGEFNTTFNESYQKSRAFYKPDLAYPLWITEVALLNEDDDIIAIGKFNAAVRKDKYEPLTVKVSINI